MLFRPLEKYPQNVETRNHRAGGKKEKEKKQPVITKIHGDSPRRVEFRNGICDSSSVGTPSWTRIGHLGWGRDMHVDPVNTLGAKDQSLHRRRKKKKQLGGNAFARPLPPPSLASTPTRSTNSSLVVFFK